MRSGRVGLSAVLMTACGPSVGLPEHEAEPSTSEATTASTTSGDMGGTTGGTAATFGDDGDGPGSASFIGMHDWGVLCAQAPEAGMALASCVCDLWRQDCDATAKCMPWSNDGSEVWNSVKCTPVDPDPDPLGAPCHVQGSASSGVDSCERGAMCWNVDAATLEGHCVGFCRGNEVAPTCDLPGHTCAIFNGGALILCLPSCDPLGDDCEEGFACHPNESSFVCVPEQDRSKISQGCSDWAGCPTGEACTTSPMSETCAPYCDLGDPLADEHCGDDRVCRPWFDDGSAPPAYAHVGVCEPA